MKILAALFSSKGIKFVLALLALFVAWMVWSAAYKLLWIAIILAVVVGVLKLRGFFKKKR
ncbi:hypothetical protein HFO56_33620 [Rhizobium laguerreae]|uniref:hypothetical protein n=1 Tax=Rhizobium laguerreae TaxID=1076926 RepID=UPI001C8FDC29|nr:hypothetical protein [Rhizobium laguerreae]MBY3157266.1 hypothetical protein [Rhizobium laguerreae]MBY3432868.1 hypothetical protein [Rhizobium laguerreae]